MRDARILPIYEGTNAIQANDLMFRKTLRDDGKSLNKILSLIKEETQTSEEILKSVNKCEDVLDFIKQNKMIKNHFHV
ncbi:MAG: hypothetical protein CM15mP114_15910 [Alphaproteobacteria bacterium]|nr:MAG: hypothetical protein CM15mP114_15910 [Alphaproteobacteria bacterium]